MPVDNEACVGLCSARNSPPIDIPSNPVFLAIKNLVLQPWPGLKYSPTFPGRFIERLYETCQVPRSTPELLPGLFEKLPNTKIKKAGPMDGPAIKVIFLSFLNPTRLELKVMLIVHYPPGPLYKEFPAVVHFINQVLRSTGVKTFIRGFYKEQIIIIVISCS